MGCISISFNFLLILWSTNKKIFDTLKQYHDDIVETFLKERRIAALYLGRGNIKLPFPPIVIINELSSSLHV